MIRLLALIGVLAFSQSLYAASDHSKAPEHNQATDSNAPQESTVLNDPTQEESAPAELQVNAPLAQPKAAEYSQNTYNDPQSTSERRPQSTPGEGGLSIIAKVAAILGAIFAACLIIPRIKAAKAAIERAKIAKQEFLANGPSIRASIGVVGGMNPEGFRIIATWINIGGRKAILTGASLEWEVTSKDTPPATPNGPLTKIQGRELGAPPDEYQYPTDRIPVENRYAICGKTHHTLYGLARLTYMGKVTNTSDSKRVKFTLTERNRAQNMSRPPRDADGAVSIFDIRLIDW